MLERSTNHDGAPLWANYLSWHMKENLNKLTRQLYAMGYTREKCPNTVYWSDWQNFGYTWETMLGFTWETPCGLLIEGQSNAGRTVAISDIFYQDIRYCPENDNPLILCPYQRKTCQYVSQPMKFLMCACHQTQKPYDYAHSVEKIEAEHEQAAKSHRQYMEITSGSRCVCVVGNNGVQGGFQRIKYDVNDCIMVGCRNPVCVIRKQARDLSRVNIFYDLRRTWITRIGFLEEKKVTITKGLKAFDKAIARTDAEIWIKSMERKRNPLTSSSIIERPKLTPLDRSYEHSSKYHQRRGVYDYFEFHYEVENIRIARSDHRDLLQDLQDIANGIQVTHVADDLKEAKAQKQARRKAAKAQQIRKVEKMILTHGWTDLEIRWKRKAEKLLDDDRIEELLQQRQTSKTAPPKDTQLSLFPGERPLDAA